MRFWRSIGLAALALAFLTLPARAQDSTAAGMKPAAKRSVPERRAWMFGLSMGYGGTRFVGSDQLVIAELRSDTGVEYPPLLLGLPDWSGTEIESAPTLQLRMGYAINPKWTVGFERSTWTKDFDLYKWDFVLSMFTATYYPGAGSCFVRGGAGVTTLAEKVPAGGTSTLAGSLVYAEPFFVQYNDHGFAIDMALGYERRLFQRISIVPELSVRSMTFAEKVRTQIGAASLGLNWWF